MAASGKLARPVNQVEVEEMDTKMVATGLPVALAASAEQARAVPEASLRRWCTAERSRC